MSQQKGKIDQFFQTSNSKQQTEIKDEGEREEQKLQPKQTISDAKTIPPIDDFLEGLGIWGPHLKAFTHGPKMKNIHQYIKKEYEKTTCYPPPHLIFNTFIQTPISKLRVVIVGQDPYINEGEAMGLCFSVPKGIKVPPSLSNIYKNLASKVPGFKIPKHGDLTKWANQGVFLLNAVLTVQAKLSNSHKDCGWVQFTDEVIKVIDKECEGIVFLLWGKPAQLKAKKVDRTKHFVLETSHPSPLSAHAGFLDSDHFLKCNQILQERGKQPIDWTID